MLSSTATTGAPRSPTAASATPKNDANTTTCRMSPLAMASTTEVGTMCRRMSQPVCCCRAIAANAAVSVLGGQGNARPGLEHVHQHQTDDERHGRGQFEPDDGLHADAAHRAQVAGPRDADDKRREQQRRDDHLDHPQEQIGERLDLDAERRPQPADEDADGQADENLRRQAREPTGRRAVRHMRDDIT